MTFLHDSILLKVGGYIFTDKVIFGELPIIHKNASFHYKLCCYHIITHIAVAGV